jgi:hypothetical protein
LLRELALVRTDRLREEPRRQPLRRPIDQLAMGGISATPVTAGAVTEYQIEIFPSSLTLELLG